MPDEITIKPKSESTSTTPASDKQDITLGRAQIVNLCAIGLGVSFFLPWANFFGANVSGFDLQKMGGQQIAGQLTGTLPFIVGVYWYLKLGSDMFQILSFGAYLSLACGAALFILTRKLN